MTRVTETKSVKVDNWGVFFLQKLQNFFNKTDHCDLTLQFNDNSQLKVHRLVLSACTDYFNMLESTCEMYDDVLIMPLDLQADVIVPIVNFMYTGTLEFQYSIYEKLLKTAKDMNMTVLLKLLEAHKQTTRLIQGGRQPVLLNKQAPTRARPGVTYQMPASVSRSYSNIRQAASARVAASVQKPATVVKHQTIISPVKPAIARYGSSPVKAGPSRFDESNVTETLEGNFDDITYESQPLVTADQIKKEDETSPFEKLRKGYTNVVKRPAPASFAQPAAKKPNLEEVKEFTEAARLRSQLAADDDDSPGFADDTRFDDDEEEDQHQQQQQVQVKLSPGVTKQIVIKQEPKTSPTTAVKQITVKDESGSVDHAKIISEVLKKYPHLVKKNKNIKLKIMQKTSPSAASSNVTATPAKIEVRTATPLKADISMVRKATEAARQPVATSTPATSAPKKIDSKTMHALIAKGAENMTGPWLCLRCGIDGRPISIPSYKAFRNHLIVKHKEKIDARICEHCGWRSESRNPHLFYHWLTEHNIKATVKFPTCSECGHVALNASMLMKHEEENHQRGDLQQCIYCNKVFEKEMDLYEHMKNLHKEKAREDGVIDFSDEEYEMETEEDTGMQNTSGDNKIKILSNISISSSSIPFVIDPRQAQTVSQIGGKPQVQLQQIALEPSSEAEALSNVASGIATSLGLVDNASVVIEDHNFQGQYIEHQMATVHGETATTTTVTASGPEQLTKLITEDGTELQLTQKQKEEIFSQLQNSENGGNVVMVLNDDQFISNAEIQLEDGTQLINAGAAVPAVQDNIVVMYSSAGEELTTTSTTTTAAIKPAPTTEDESSQVSTQPSVATDDEDSKHEQHDEESEHDKEDEKAAKEREKQKLISELEGDWSEDTEEQPTAASPTPTSSTTKAAAPEEAEKEAECTKTEATESTEEATVKEETQAEEDTGNKEEGISELLDDWNNGGKSIESEAGADTEKKLQKVVEAKEDEPPKEEPTQPEESSVADHMADSVDESSINDSETQIVIMAAESETEVSTREEDADNSQKGEEDPVEEADSKHDHETSEIEEAAAQKEEKSEQEEEVKDDGEKAKSKEVVNSLLGDWDEDDDL